MLKFINKIPAGTFLVPLLLSMLCYTFWPDMTRIGGITEAVFSGDYQNFIVGVLCVFSGTGINLKTIDKMLKRQGVLLIVKFVVAIVLGLLFLNFVGLDGVWGISALAFVVVVASINPAVYLGIAKEYGTLDDQGAYGFTGLFSIPFVPMLIFGIYFSGGIAGMDWMPVISTLIPLGIGIILGNLDSGFKDLFVPGVGATLPLLGWNIGQSSNLFDALESGIPGIALTIFFLITCLALYFTDTLLLKNDGVIALAMFNVAGLSVSTPAVLAALYPQLQGDMISATAQVLTACVITSIISPIITGKRHDALYN
ncbi:2-keto-3-deoxygluconate permease [Aerococcaceae bacterium DSM 111022]|nr:2-keto-3-deoxygluconate permease [Aerococcaceae bacterium DSM 111022]